MSKDSKKTCPVCYQPLKKGAPTNFCSEECRDEYVAYEEGVLDLKDDFGFSRTVIPPGR